MIITAVVFVTIIMWNCCWFGFRGKHFKYKHKSLSYSVITELTFAINVIASMVFIVWLIKSLALIC